MITNSEIKVIETEINDNDIVMDIGFYTGDWTKEVFKKKGCQVYAFEAINNIIFPNSFLHKRFTIFDDIILSDKNDSVNFYLYIDHPHLSSIYKQKENTQIENPNILKKKSLTLDFICRKHDIKKIDFMKLDTCGAELNVLKGCTELLSKNKIDRIQFYFGENANSGNTLQETILFLQYYGFKKFYKMTIDDIIETTVFKENEIWCNYLCLK